MASCTAASGAIPRVVARDGVNARDLSITHVPDAPQAIVIDVSFIGLGLVAAGAGVGAARRLAGGAGQAAIRGSDDLWVGKGGIIRDAEIRPKP